MRNNPPARGGGINVCCKPLVKLPRADCTTIGNLFAHPCGIHPVEEPPRQQVPNELRQKLLSELKDRIILNAHLTEQLLTHRRLNKRIEPRPHQGLVRDVRKNLRPLQVIVLDRLVLIRANIALAERNEDKTAIERLRLVLRGRQLVGTEHTQATTLDTRHWAVLNVEASPIVSNPRLERPSSLHVIANLVLIRENAKSATQLLRKILLSKIRH